MAFWKIFRKKVKSEPRSDANTKDPMEAAIKISTFIIDLQLKRAGTLPGFSEAFYSNFTRGYFVGCFNSAMQAFKIDGHDSDAKLAAFIVIGHLTLLGEEHGTKFARDSIALQGNREYDLGNRLGGQELVDFLNKKITMPTQLFNYFKGNRQ
ncbi:MULTISPECIES: hypothetical protein [Pseudomonas]|uniref:hypothetical protein n=1 Tax=Pseudomonas guariconensis TaxID=1288410 RepID=UPI0020976D4E|nr:MULTISPECIES: hypothetical protein [Pseudomonas]MCO7597522.1 hypothetical protein [Pseudomonas guariconensis]MCU7223237.1 hypothetical protein [Pseudomonas brassicacearum]